jgi:hypothetical protein
MGIRTPQRVENDYFYWQTCGFGFADELSPPRLFCENISFAVGNLRNKTFIVMALVEKCT